MRANSLDKRFDRSPTHCVDSGEILRDDCLHVLGIVVLDYPDRLDAMREGTPRGRANWQLSSVRMPFERSDRPGLRVRQMD